MYITSYEHLRRWTPYWAKGMNKGGIGRDTHTIWSCVGGGGGGGNREGRGKRERERSVEGTQITLQVERRISGFLCVSICQHISHHSIQTRS